jgi:hypothetical protein
MKEKLQKPSITVSADSKDVVEVVCEPTDANKDECTGKDNSQQESDFHNPTKKKPSNIVIIKQKTDLVKIVPGENCEEA